MLHNFAHNLYHYRTEKNWNQKQAAQKLGLLPSTYQKYESGINEPRISTLLQIANFYKVSLDELVGVESESE
jgi:transcriptional regulator with XRE-family HTH domain